MFDKLEAQPIAYDSFSALNFLRQCYAIIRMEFKKIWRDPTELASRSVQPTLWLVVFGQVFSRVQGIPTGNISYLAFMCPGILAQSVLFSSIFYGISIIWEKDLGIIHKLLVSPAHRSALVIGKAFSAGLRGVVQALVIYILAFFLGIELRTELGSVLLVFVAVVMGSAVFSTFSLTIACLVKTRERFMGIGQVLTMPLFFASSAIYPVHLMPRWLQIVAEVNPLTYLVDAIRGLMIVGGESVHGLGFDFFILSLSLFLLIAVATKLYPTLVQ